MLINKEKLFEVVEDIEITFNKHKLDLIEKEYVIDQLKMITEGIKRDATERTMFEMKKLRGMD